MKEIKILIQQLRNYPNNFFIYPYKLPPEDIDYGFISEHPNDGLVVCNHLGEEQGFIETGGKGEVIIE